MPFTKKPDGTYVWDPKGKLKLPPSDALKNISERPAVRDGDGRPLTRGGDRSGKVDWNQVERERNGGS